MPKCCPEKTPNRVKNKQTRHSSFSVRWPVYRGRGAGRWAESSLGARGLPYKPPRLCPHGGQEGRAGGDYGLATRQRQFPTWDRRTNGHPTYGKRASSPSDKGWTEDSWTSSCTAFAACTWRSSLPAWQPTRETSRLNGDSLFPVQPRPRLGNPYPWDDFVAPLPWDIIRHPPRLRPGTPPGWRWPQDFIHDFVRWARALAWMPGPAEVSRAKLALDYEVSVGRALLASPDHRLRGTHLPLGERAQILRKPVDLAERHLAAGTLLSGTPLGRCRSLLPLGGLV